MKMRPVSAMLILVTAFALGTQSGCTPTRTAEDNQRLVNRLLEREAEMLVEDIGHFWLLDHPTRLTTWHAKD